jgi:hypothetical protein
MPAYVVWRTGMSKRVVVSAHQARNRFLSFLKGLRIRALEDFEENVSDAHQKALNFLYILKSIVKKSSKYCGTAFRSIN